MYVCMYVCITTTDCTAHAQYSVKYLLVPSSLSMLEGCSTLRNEVSLIHFLRKEKCSRVDTAGSKIFVVVMGLNVLVIGRGRG